MWLLRQNKMLSVDPYTQNKKRAIKRAEEPTFKLTLFIVLRVVLKLLKGWSCFGSTFFLSACSVVAIIDVKHASLLCSPVML